MALLGVKNQSVLLTLPFPISQTWTCGLSGIVRVLITGGGGSGAAGKSNASNDQGFLVTGGGAGGCSEKIISVTAGDTYTITIGAGGIGKNIATNAGKGIQAGNAGGASRFVTASGTTIDLNAGGGGAGQGENLTGTGSAVAGGTGGSASGGSRNAVGGAGGAQLASAHVTCQNATGGGAVGIWGNVGNAGGLIAPATSSNHNDGKNACSGGGGVGGVGGGVTINATYKAATNFASGTGGGSGGPGTDNASDEVSGTNTTLMGNRPTNGGVHQGSAAVLANFGTNRDFTINLSAIAGANNQGATFNGIIANELLMPVGQGGAFNVGAGDATRGIAYPGGGGGGFSSSATGANYATLYGGGGGKVCNTDTTELNQPMGGAGGGGGGGMGATTNAGVAFSGAGGNGICIIQYLSFA